MQEAAFGYELTSTGHRRINNVGIIQGDGVDSDTLIELLTLMETQGWSADCILFGSGGSLLQKVNRDTLSFAQKACAILINGQWQGIAKNPVTDSKKKSKEGLLTLARNRDTGELKTMRLDQGAISAPWADIMQLNYHTGKLYNETTLAAVRERASN
jgi:nicotinamide phosphoribosyltransferase